MIDNILTKRYKCANCGYIYDYTVQVGDYRGYAKQCIKCESTALDEIKKESEV